MKTIVAVLSLVTISSTSFAANKVWTMEKLFSQPDALVACKDITRNDPKDINVTVFKEYGKAIGSVFQDDKSILEAALIVDRPAANSYGNYKTWVGRGFKISVNMDIRNPMNNRGELDKSFSTDGYLDYTDNKGKKVHSALFCQVKLEVVR